LPTGKRLLPTCSRRLPTTAFSDTSSTPKRKNDDTIQTAGHAATRPRHAQAQTRLTQTLSRLELCSAQMSTLRRSRLDGRARTERVLLSTCSCRCCRHYRSPCLTSLPRPPWKHAHRPSTKTLSTPPPLTGLQHDQRRPSRPRLSKPVTGESHRKAHGNENMVQEKSDYSHVHLIVKKTQSVAVASAWKLTFVPIVAGTLGATTARLELTR